jgi:hypothetical protein
MLDQTQRCLWLEQGYTAICKAFGFEAKNILITASYPPAGARGALERVRPADFDTQWAANDNEKDGFLSIHPMSFKPADANDPMGLAALRAILWAMGRTHHGVRHGASKVGLSKNHDATITADAETDAKLRAILSEVGEPPSGFAEPFPVKKVQRSRMVTYACHCSGVKFYATSAKIQAICQQCSTQFQTV